MQTYSYITRDGQQKSVQANNESEASRLATDIAPTSGFQVDRSLPSLEETGATAGELPEAQPSRLLSFARATQLAVQLARESRNKFALEETGKAFPTGILPNFGSILGNLNQASDDFAGGLLDELEAAREADEGKYELRTVGKQLIQFQLGPTGEVIGQKVVATAPEGADGGTDFFDENAKQDLLQGRLSGADPRVQVIFTRTPKEFRDSWIRNNVGYDNSAVTAEALLADLEAWERLQEEEDDTSVTFSS